MKLGAERLQTHLKQGLASLYLITGDEPLLVTEAAEAVRARARDDGYGAREIYVAERGFDWQRVQSETRNLSLFAERRIIEVRLPDGKPGTEGARVLAAIAADPPGDVLMLIVALQFDRKSGSAKWVKALASAGVHVHARGIPPARLPGWIDTRMKRRGLQPSRGATRLLAERVEGNLLAADQEIDKLLLARGPGEVDEAAVMQSVADSARFDVFQLTDAALEGDVTRAMRILTGLLAEGVAAPLILWALEREVRAMAKVSWHIEHGARPADALARAGVWSQRRSLLHEAVKRQAGPAAFAGLIEQAGRADRVAKGAEHGQIADALATLVAGIAGTVLPRPVVFAA